MLFTHGSKEGFRREKREWQVLKSSIGYSGLVSTVIGLRHYRILRLRVLIYY